MNKSRWLAVLAAALISLSAGVVIAETTRKADDPLTVAPDMYKLLFENDRVRVMEVTFQPGQKIAKHSHPDHYVYVAEGGLLKISKPDGSNVDANLTPGQIVWIPAETHWATNGGKTKIRLIVNELKEPKPESK